MKDKYLIGGDVWTAEPRHLGGGYRLPGEAICAPYMSAPTMQRLVEQGIATEILEPREVTFRFGFDYAGHPQCYFPDLIRETFGGNPNAYNEVANKTYDVTVKEVVE